MISFFLLALGCLNENSTEGHSVESVFKGLKSKLKGRASSDAKPPAGPSHIT